MSEELTNPTPHIVDLSDETRPTKLAEMYEEIYDNEWTDAWKELTKSNEKENIVIAELLMILQVSNTFLKTE
ncbi:hypothetical protein DPMN_107337 [Dreissena polymorpha]|uniref:Uncharacterized protein n=1 Tax=Dreissena polymorpha TaxID=45954 RepID=A0A9D4K6W2_DREPO|nr:hypothetical protein DPMN_107337 [Dreissena polymorpha]